MCLTPVKNVTNYVTSGKVPTRGSFVPQNKTVRCLFSPESLPITKKKPKNDLCSPVRRRFYQKGDIPSFDTPNRSLLSPSELSKTFRGFVLGRGSYGVVVRGLYKNDKLVEAVAAQPAIYDLKTHIGYKRGKENIWVVIANEVGKSKKIMAVKVVPKTNKCSQKSLSGEINAMSLKHPNIVQVYQVIEQHNSKLSFVFMELSSLQNLEDLLDTLIPLKVKLKYLIETARALEYCHRHGVLHLDVKPKNLILNLSNNSCKLCDFGSSILVSETKKICSPTKGTIKYCAPEILKGHVMATEKADVYSFGVTMWQLIHEKTPYDKEDLHVIVYKVVTQNYRPDNNRTALNNKVESIYKTCWEADQNKRPSMSSVKAMLKAV